MVIKFYHKGNRICEEFWCLNICRSGYVSNYFTAVSPRKLVRPSSSFGRPSQRASVVGGRWRRPGGGGAHHQHVHRGKLTTSILSQRAGLLTSTRSPLCQKYFWTSLAWGGFWNGLWESKCSGMMESLEKEYRLKIPEKWSKSWEEWMDMALTRCCCSRLLFLFWLGRQVTWSIKTKKTIISINIISPKKRNHKKRWVNFAPPFYHIKKDCIWNKKYESVWSSDREERPETELESRSLAWILNNPTSHFNQFRISNKKSNFLIIRMRKQIKKEIAFCQKYIHLCLPPPVLSTYFTHQTYPPTKMAPLKRSKYNWYNQNAQDAQSLSWIFQTTCGTCLCLPTPGRDLPYTGTLT